MRGSSFSTIKEKNREILYHKEIKYSTYRKMSGKGSYQHETYDKLLNCKNLQLPFLPSMLQAAHMIIISNEGEEHLIGSIYDTVGSCTLVCWDDSRHLANRRGDFLVCQSKAVRSNHIQQNGIHDGYVNRGIKTKPK